MKGWSPGFNMKAVLLSLTTGSVSSGKLSTFDIIGSKNAQNCGCYNKPSTTVEVRKVTHEDTICHHISLTPYLTDSTNSTKEGVSWISATLLCLYNWNSEVDEQLLRRHLHDIGNYTNTPESKGI